MTDILLAVLLDFIIGDPYKLPHPVRFMGKIINIEEKIARSKAKNKRDLRKYGFLLALINILVFFFLPYIILNSLEYKKNIYRIVNVYIIYTCISARSLEIEAVKVRKSLGRGLDKARKQLSKIVGRDTQHLDKEDIVKATVETVAENTSDGIVAPLFFISLFGAAGGIMYKAVNTMDSMLGYKNEKYIDLGKYPAKIDDIYNYIPARITGILMCISSISKFNYTRGFKVMLRDGKKHDSPNAGWPEAAVAGLLGIEIGGPGVYQGNFINKASIGDKVEFIEKSHIIDTIYIMYRTEFAFIVLLVLIKLVSLI